MAVLSQMSMMAVFALSYNMQMGQAGLLSFGHAVFFGLGGYATAGVLSRKDAGGKSRKSLLINVDALRLLKPDAAPQAVRQLQSLAGEVLNRLPQR